MPVPPQKIPGSARGTCNVTDAKRHKKADEILTQELEKGSVRNTGSVG